MTNQDEKSALQGSRWSRFKYYALLINYVWPIPCALVGYTNLPLITLVPAAMLVWWFVPEFWVIRDQPRVAFQKQVFLPRKFMQIILSLTAIYILFVAFTFHTVGRVVLSYTSDEQLGIPRDQILWYGISIFVLNYFWRLLRRKAQSACNEMIS